MKILLINPPHTAIGSRIPDDHLPPLGLLSIGGPLIDAGFAVELLDADLENLPLPHIVEEVVRRRADVVMLGHSGSSSAHVTVVALCDALKRRLPDVVTVYGGVHPTYHWDEILAACSSIDVIVRGEGEQTAVDLMRALREGQDLRGLRGIAYREAGPDGAPKVVETTAAPMIRRLDDYRVGWELIDHARYTYWGGKRAVVVQFSRGCPYLCNYCGQRGFWTQWRHRDPVRLAREIARLHREHGVELINFADELPTGSRRMWRIFLEALIAEQVPVLLVGSTRAGDIVRDADLLPLYRRAGVIRFLLGIESYSESTLARIGKGASMHEDQQAIQLLRQHGILSMATYVVGFEEEKDADLWRSLCTCCATTPTRSSCSTSRRTAGRRSTGRPSTARSSRPTPAAGTTSTKVLATRHMPAWRLFMWFKAMELILQLRPKALCRLLLHPDPVQRQSMRWYSEMGRRTWFKEVFEFMFRTERLSHGPELKDFLGPTLETREYALDKAGPARRTIPLKAMGAAPTREAA